MPSLGSDRVVRRGYASGRVRSAGILIPPTDNTTPQLPATADFAQDAVGDPRSAYWMAGSDLFRSTGPQVLADVRQDLGVTTGDFAWTPGLLELVAQRARSRGAGPPALPQAGAQLSREWLRLALWVVYQGAMAQPLSQVRLPALLRLPNIGQVLTVVDRVGTVVTPGFNPALLASNPFEVRGAGFNVSGSRPMSDQTKMLLVVVAGLLLIGGDK